MALSEYSRSYNSLAGADIKAQVGNKVLSTLQAISFSVTREKAPIYTMGDPNPRSFSRNKRGIAGTAIFIMFDRHPLLNAAALGNYRVSLDVDELMQDFTDPNSSTTTQLSIVSSNRNVTAGSTVFEAETAVSGPWDDQVLANPFYADQIPPFDITLIGANEYGAMAKMALISAEILSEGGGTSIDDVVSEHQFSFICRGLVHWRAVEPNNINYVGTEMGNPTTGV